MNRTMLNLGKILLGLLLIQVWAGCAQFESGDQFPSYFYYFRKDVSRINFSKLENLYTAETGAAVTVDISLHYVPDGDVTIPNIQSTNLDEGQVSPSSLTFTSQNYNTPQQITITGVNDDVNDGPQSYYITFGNVESGDFFYSGQKPRSLLVLNSDEDDAGIIVTSGGGLVVNETGSTGTFTVVLQSQPVADVQVGLSLDDKTEAVLSNTSVIFTPTDWDVPRVVTVTGTDDLIDDGNQTYKILTSPSLSDDPIYNGIDADDVNSTTVDNDAAFVEVTTPGCGLFTFEDVVPAGTTKFSVQLRTEPLGIVTIPISSSNKLEGDVSPSVLTFTDADWNIPQEVTVTGVDGFGTTETDVTYQINLGPAVSPGNVDYDGRPILPHTAVNIHNDLGGVAIRNTCNTLSTTEASSARGQFQITLRQDPLGSLALTPISSDLTEAIPAAASPYLFDSANWFQPITVFIDDVDDFVADPDQPYVISFEDASATTVPGSQSMLNINNDHVGVQISSSIILFTSEAGGTASFKVRLRSQPGHTVTIVFESNDKTEGKISSSPAAVFHTTDWNVYQTITVQGQGDDGDSSFGTLYQIIVKNVNSADSDYAGVIVPIVSVVNLD